jgi:hypothetical protein
MPVRSQLRPVSKVSSSFWLRSKPAAPMAAMFGKLPELARPWR